MCFSRTRCHAAEEQLIYCFTWFCILTYLLFLSLGSSLCVRLCFVLNDRLVCIHLGGNGCAQLGRKFNICQVIYLNSCRCLTWKPTIVLIDSLERSAVTETDKCTSIESSKFRDGERARRFLLTVKPTTIFLVCSTNSIGQTNPTGISRNPYENKISITLECLRNLIDFTGKASSSRRHSRILYADTWVHLCVFALERRMVVGDNV